MFMSEGSFILESEPVSRVLPCCIWLAIEGVFQRHCWTLNWYGCRQFDVHCIEFLSLTDIHQTYLGACDFLWTMTFR